MTAENFIREERWIPVAESGDHWHPRDQEGAEDAMRKYPAGGTYTDGAPWDGITHIIREVRWVTPWVAPLPEGGDA